MPCTTTNYNASWQVHVKEEQTCGLMVSVLNEKGRRVAPLFVPKFFFQLLIIFLLAKIESLGCLIFSDRGSGCLFSVAYKKNGCTVSQSSIKSFSQMAVLVSE